jgi:hypothetical protein
MHLMAPDMHSVYKPPWRPAYHPPPYDGHTPDSRCTSTASTPLPHQGYPVMPNRELPQLPHFGLDDPYSCPGSISGPPPHPAKELSTVHASYRPIHSTPTSAPLPPLSFITPGPPIPPGTLGPYDPGYCQARPRKAARATQVSIVSTPL